MERERSRDGVGVDVGFDFHDVGLGAALPLDEEPLDAVRQ